MDPTDARVTVADGVALHVRQWAGPGRPFLLVHGLSSNARLWDEVAPRLAAAGHPVTAVDLRSHGESDAPPGGYDTATAAADLARVAEKLAGRPPAIVVGQSWGGNVAVSFAARFPELVAGLALVDGGWVTPADDFPSWAECEAAMRPPDIDGMPADQLAAGIRVSHPDWSATAIAATLANLRVAPDGSLTRRLSIAHHLEILRSLWDDPPAPYYPAITAPVLLIPAIPASGAESTRAKVAAVAARLGNARVREYVGADHDIHAQHPAEIAADLLDLAARTGA